MAARKNRSDKHCSLAITTCFTSQPSCFSWFLVEVKILKQVQTSKVKTYGEHDFLQLRKAYASYASQGAMLLHGGLTMHHVVYLLGFSMSQLWFFRMEKLAGKLPLQKFHFLKFNWYFKKNGEKENWVVEGLCVTKASDWGWFCTPFFSIWMPPSAFFSYSWRKFGSQTSNL